MAAAPTPRLFIGNLPSDTDFADVYSIVAPLGKPTVVEFINGAAFVDFADAAAVQKGLDLLNGKDYNGKTLTAEAARAPLNLESADIHVVGLSDTLSEQALTELLKPAGQVVKVQLFPKNDNHAAHATATFDNTEQALKAVQTLFGSGSSIQAFVQQRRVTRAPGQGRPRRQPNRAEADKREHIDVPFSFLVHARYSGALIGKGGAVIKQILQSCSARVTLESKDDHPRVPERLVQIKGTFENVGLAFKEILAILKTEAEKSEQGSHDLTVKALFPVEAIGHVIGKSGAYINKIKEVVPSVTIAPCDHVGVGANFQEIVITGTPENLFEAQQLIHQKLTSVANSTPVQLPDPFRSTVVETVTLLIPNSAVGSIIGQKGAVLRDIVTRSRASVNVDKVGEDAGEDSERRVVITGTADALETAQHMISSCLQQKGVRMKSIVAVPVSVVGHVIGKQGSQINQISARSRASLRVETVADKGHVIIEGSVMNMVIAQRMVLQIVEEYA